MPASIRCQRVDWTEVFELCYQLALQIRQAGFQPDLVLAIARGGYVPARLLCDYLDLYQLGSLRVEHYAAGARKTAEARLHLAPGMDVTGQKLLLVDDVDDTGDTLALAQQFLQAQKPDDMRVAVLHHKTCSSSRPDFFAAIQSDWHWLTYPWAVTEDIRGFVSRLQPPPLDLEDIRRRLDAEFGMQVSLEILEKIRRLDPAFPQNLYHPDGSS